jgi:hypothetical protein
LWSCECSGYSAMLMRHGRWWSGWCARVLLCRTYCCVQ